MADGSPRAVDFRPLSLEEVLDAIGSSEPSSGAGIAAALSLSMAAACAQKAVGISLKHRADEGLEASDVRLAALRDRALDHARVEAQLFASFLRSREARDAAQLVTAAERFQRLSRELERELADLHGRIDDVVAGDLAAAMALQRAAASIEAQILRENRRARARVTL